MAFCFLPYSNAQQIDPTTGNLIYTDANPPPGGYAAQGASWTGPFVGTNSSGGGYSGGNVPGWNPTTGTWLFGYSQGTVSYSTSIPAAFANAGPGILVNGFTYSWNYYNQQDYRGTLSSNINITNSAGAVLHSYNYNMPQTTTGWTNMSGVQNFGVQYNPLSLGNLNFSLTGKDDRFWAGYYGPQIKDIDVRLKYTVDPCVANPLYASTCPGFNDIVTSGNLMGSNPAISWGQSFNEIIAISTALQHGGMGVRVHGFNWGYDVISHDPYYAGIFWTDHRDPLARTTVNITDSSGQSIYSVVRDYNDINSWQGKSYSYNLTNSTNSLNLGNFSIQGQTWDYAGIQNVYVTAKYTPDQCVTNPLYNSSCTGYQQAYFDQQCTSNPLYNNQCPGYAEAYYNQQCSLSALYDSGCPGYAQAYYTQQCSINPLYDSGCPGYAQAFFNQQCTLNPLYNAQCPGYAQAKALKDLQEKQETAAETFAVPTPSITRVETSSSTVALADPTKTEAVVTTDVGGVELTTSGQVSIPTGQPTATKEAIKEAAVEKKEEKKTVNPKHLQLAQAAAKESERTALNTASEAVTLSQSETTTSSALGFGPGINVQQRASGTTDSESQTNTVTQSRTQTNPLQGSTNLAPQGQEQNQKNGPSVRNGGKVDGMEGGPDPAMLAKTPTDFNQYLQSQLLDSQFYATKEIYKGQRTVDNARAERFLNGKSDVIHQRMIEQQYNIGN